MNDNGFLNLGLSHPQIKLSGKSFHAESSGSPSIRSACLATSVAVMWTLSD